MADNKEKGLFDIEPSAKAEADRTSKAAVGERTLKKYEEMGYDRYEVVSAWIKEMRRGDVSAAMYWCRIIMEAGDIGQGNTEDTYLARRLQIFATEDLTPEEGKWAIPYTSALSRVLHEPAHALGWATFLMCKAQKWWETADGVECRKTMIEVKSEIHSWLRKKKFDWEHGVWAPATDADVAPKRAIPSYAIDCHTRRGKGRTDRGEPLDARMSGDSVGITERLKQAEKNGNDPSKWKGVMTCNWGADAEKLHYEEEAKAGRPGRKVTKKAGGK